MLCSNKKTEPIRKRTEFNIYKIVFCHGWTNIYAYLSFEIPIIVIIS